jgi:high-affinity K+ transport system ATPase subunit B
VKHNDEITRRKFLKRAGKLVYLTPVMYTFFTETKEAIAQGRAAARAAALEQRVDRLEAAAAAGNQQAAQQLQRIRERLVSPP